MILAILALASACLTGAIVDAKIFEPVRNWILRHNGEDGWFTYLVHCLVCASFWVGLGWAAYACLFLGVSWTLLVPLGFAFSYLTILLNDLRGS